MTVTIVADVQTDNRVLIAVDGLEDEVPAVDRIQSIRRVAIVSDESFNQPVRGTVGIDVADPLVIVDREAPFGAPVQYVVSWVRTDLTLGTVMSDPVFLSADYPRLSDPFTGEYVDCTVETWPQVAWSYGTVVMDVHGTGVAPPAPVVISGPQQAGQSTLGIRFDAHNVGGPARLRSLLANGRVILLRAPCPTVEGYFAVQSLAELRVTQDPADPRRRVQLDVVHVGPPDTFLAATLPTLADLAAFEPGTLADLAGDFATLRDIAVADLGL